MSCCGEIHSPGISCSREFGHDGQHRSAEGTEWWEPVTACPSARSSEAESLADILAAAAESKLRLRRLRVGDIEIEFEPYPPPAVEQPATPTAEHPVIESLKDLFPNGLGARRSPGG